MTAAEKQNIYTGKKKGGETGVISSLYRIQLVNCVMHRPAELGY